MGKKSSSCSRGRTSLRIHEDVLRSIDRYLDQSEQVGSRNTWITSAICEKLLREEQAPYYTGPTQNLLTFYEFFAGGGMARMGLGLKWRCTLANDIDKKKAKAYAINWGGEELVVRDVQQLKTSQLPGQVSLAWASFPCQDLSLAGNGAGLAGERSGTFWGFWKLMRGLAREDRAPDIIVLENVTGAITSEGGRDFLAILQALADAGYDFGPLVIDAALFLPQSRPRLFIVAVRSSGIVPTGLTSPCPEKPFHTEALEDAFDLAPPAIRKRWHWWKLPAPPRRTSALADLIESKPNSVEWHEPSETQKLLDMMSPVNRRKIEAAQQSGRLAIGTLYRRTRNGLQRAEVRFDDTAGCLRTPGGGSSRQTILIIQSESVRSRLITPREAARLMGLPDKYRLPSSYNDAYHLLGDGLVVPVVSHLSEHLLTPLARARLSAETTVERKRSEPVSDPTAAFKQSAHTVAA